MYLKSIGIDPKVAKAVVFPGGGPAQTAMLGGHIDVYVASPRSMVPLQNEGRARILGDLGAAARRPGAQADAARPSASTGTTPCSSRGAASWDRKD